MKYLLILVTLLIVGCGETQDAYTPPTPAASTIDMELNRAYAVSTGDRVDNASSDAELKIVKDLEGETTQVTLVLGSAQLIRNR